MSIEEENKALILKGWELLNNRDVASFINLLDPDFVEHFSEGDISLEQFKETLMDYYNTFPDDKATVDIILAEGDMVAVRVTHRGTHKGEFMGISPTGKSIDITNTGIARIVDGKEIEAWSTIDSLRLMQQLGAIPSQ